MQNSIRLKIEPLRSVAHGVIHAAGPGVFVSIDAVNPALLYPSRILLFQNFTNADLMISHDGINDAFPIASKGFILLDVTSNKSSLGGIFCAAQGDRFYVAQLEDPTSGSLYLTSFYGSEG